MKRVEAQDFTTAERFRLLVEAVQDYGIFMLDPLGHVVSWNAGAERIKGYRAQEIIGRHFSVFYPEAAQATRWPDQELQLALAQGRYEEEGWRIRKDGSRFWANVVITPLFDEQGTHTGFGKVTRDLTERRAHEEALLQSEERFRLLIDGVREYAIYMLDPEGRIQSWNKGAELIKGYLAHEVLGKHYSMFFRREDKVEGLPAWQLQRALLHGKTEEEGWRMRKDGSAFWASIVVSPIVGPGGTLLGYAKVTRDMSEQRKLHELEHSLQRMNEFLAMLGHELRNPLAPMRNAVTLMQREETLNTAQRISRDIIDRQLTHLTRLLDDLLDAGRLTSGKLHIKPLPTDFRQVLTQAVEALWPAMNARSLEIELKLPEGEIQVNADEVRLIQVLQNLLSNATKFTPEGGRIEVRVVVVQERLLVDVADNGMGMSEQTLDNVFQLFSQGEGVRETHQPGLGIGLALARSIVEMHGGTISVVSAGPGKGSVFSFELPGASLRA